MAEGSGSGDDIQARPITDDNVLPLPMRPQGLVFNVVGGTRMILIRAGPGKRSDLEHQHGYVEGVSNNPVDEPSAVTTLTQAALIGQGLPSFITQGKSPFLARDGIRFPLRGIQVFHDGEPKSRATFDAVMSYLPKGEASQSTLPAADCTFVDGMKRKPSTVSYLQWLRYAAFHDDFAVLRPVVVFAGWNTMQRVLAKARRYKPSVHMEGPVAGSACVIDFPAHDARPAMVHALFDSSMSLRAPGVWANSTHSLRPLFHMVGDCKAAVAASEIVMETVAATAAASAAAIEDILAAARGSAHTEKATELDAELEAEAKKEAETETDAESKAKAEATKAESGCECEGEEEGAADVDVSMVDAEAATETHADASVDASAAT